MHRLWLRITLSFLVLMFFVLLVSGFFLSEMIKNTYIDLKRNQLNQSAALMLKALEMNGSLDDPEQLQQMVDDLSGSNKPRFTVIDLEGNVLADSIDDPKRMENHADRPEVRQIIKNGKKSGLSIRYSGTLGYNMMYVTIPMYRDDAMTGVMRASLTLENIEHAISNLRKSLSLVLFAALLLTAIVGMRLAKGISRPIEEMITVSEKLKEKEYTARVKMEPKGELGQLADAINILAASLKKQMDQIQENEQQLTGVLTNMVSGVLLVNKEGKILLANRAMGQILGSDPETFTGKLHMEVGRSVSLSRLIEQCLKDGKEIRDEIHFFYPDERILDAHLAPYMGENGEMKGIIAVLHDITHIRRLEKMRSEFVANVSHELRTPITSVKGFAETLLDGAMEDEELLKSFLKIIHEESNRLHRLINDILHLSKIEQPSAPLHIEPFNLAEAVLATAETVRKEAVKKGLELVLPEKHEIWMEGEKDRIQQIILNLISNAMAYTPEGGKITVSLMEKEEEVELEVADTGIGIASKELPRIFERFYRVDKARSRDSGGTGLGLAIVKHLVESHHGSIHVESEEGKGTVFTVILPRKQRSPAE